MRFLLLTISSFFLASVAVAAPRYDVEVMAVLSRSGCNLGACHGNATGKGGFKISLRGEDPEGDWKVLTKDFASRRINLSRPEESLLLLKATGTVAHQGGVRFKVDSPEYAILRDWIVAGAPRSSGDSEKLVKLEVTPSEKYVVEPESQVQLKATAKFLSGETIDVTGLACYETSNLNAGVDRSGRVTRTKVGETTVIVRFLHKQVPVHLAFLPARPDFVWSNPPVNNYIDRHVGEKLKLLRTNPSQLADDAVFVRRAFLDATGSIPTAEEARDFVADESPDKRKRLIDLLLERDEFADYWTLKWSDLLRNEEKVLDEKGVDVFYRWIRDSIARDKPVDQFVRELVTSRGSTYLFPAANYYRANRDPITRAETTARLFLGVRLQCAKCHNHPFDRWTQDDYYNWAAWFPQIEYQLIANKRADDLDKNAFNGEQIVEITGGGKVKNARTDADAVPKFLGAETPEVVGTTDRPSALAEWLTSPKNDLFVAAQVNFIWFHLMGRGLVDPIDDLRATNPPSHPELMRDLGQDFADHGFSLRHLVRRIMNSRTYQLSSEPNATNRSDDANYAKAIVRRLSAEQLIDAQSAVIGIYPKFHGYSDGTRAIQIRGTHRGGQGKNGPIDGDRLLKMLGKPERLLSCDCERSSETTLSQAFLSISDEGLQSRLSDPKNRLKTLLDRNLADVVTVDEMYWTALGRAPSRAEQEIAVALLDSSSDRFVALQDLTWALLNSKEFVFRR